MYSDQYVHRRGKRPGLDKAMPWYCLASVAKWVCRYNLHLVLIKMILIWLYVAAAGVWTTVAQNCSSGEECPERAPCCSEYGWCGTGQAFCLGGCEPFGELWFGIRRLNAAN